MTKEYLIGGIELDLSELDSMVIGNDLPVAEAEEVVKNSDNAIDKIKEFYALSEKISNLQKYGGFHNWFVPGTPYGIDKLHKHREFLFAGAKYHERYFSAANRCKVAGTKVLMADGYEKNIEDVVVGDEVLSYDISKHALVKATVVDTYEGEDETYLYGNQRGRDIGCTDDHQFLALSNRGVLKMSPISKISSWVGQETVVVPQKWIPDEIVDPGFSTDVAFLLGILVGDGYLKAKDDRFKFTNNSLELCEKVKKIAEEQVGGAASIVKAKDKNYYDVFFSKGFKGNTKSPLFYLLDKTGLYGSGSGDKEVPPQILVAPEEHVRQFIHGLLAADGNASDARYSLYTTSPRLAQGFKMLCLRLGVFTGCYTRKFECEQHADMHVVTINGDKNLEIIGNVPTKPYKPRKGVRHRKDILGFKMTKKANLGKQKVYCITVDHPDHLFVANGYVTANCGKTRCATFELTLHLTGLYPEWWKGRRFKKPIMAYAAGSTNETTRNILQKQLLGEIGSEGTGMIPADLILKTTSKSGVSNAVDMLQVKHCTGGTSILRFKSYDQGRRAFEGEEVDFIVLDEMPTDLEVYSECYTRTATTNGMIMVTATPLDGLTPVVLAFYSQADFLPADTPLPSVISNAKTEYQMGIEEARKAGEKVTDLSQKSSKAVVVAGWDDAPWLEEDAKVRILAATPPHLRQARSTGIPGDSGGMVFPIALSEITVDDFPIPAHYKFINGLDPGWHYTGAVFGALDPDTDTLYIYADYRRGQVETVVHAEAIKSKSKWADAPVIFDYAGMGGRPESESTRTLYRKYGLKLINADKAVEAGLAEMWNRMSTGRLKIFKSCKILLQEISTYRRDDKGKIVKENDHCCDPGRYICQGIKHARNMTTNTSSNLGSFKGQVSGRKYWS